MADNNRLTAETRTQFGKGAARKIRATNKIPAVIYGHGTDPRHVTLPGHETGLILRKANALLELDIEGATTLALVKDVQKDPVRQLIEHIDLVIVRRGEKVTVDVPVHLEGESAAGTIATLDAQALSVEVEATDIPERITVDIEGLEDGTQVLAAQVPLPGGATLVSDGEALVVAISIPTAADLGETDDAETADDAEGDSVEETGEGSGSDETSGSSDSE